MKKLLLITTLFTTMLISNGCIHNPAHQKITTSGSIVLSTNKYTDLNNLSSDIMSYLTKNNIDTDFYTSIIKTQNFSYNPVNLIRVKENGIVVVHESIKDCYATLTDTSKNQLIILSSKYLDDYKNYINNITAIMNTACDIDILDILDAPLINQFTNFPALPQYTNSYFTPTNITVESEITIESGISDDK